MCVTKPSKKQINYIKMKSLANPKSSKKMKSQKDTMFGKYENNI